MGKRRDGKIQRALRFTHDARSGDRVLASILADMTIIRPPDCVLQTKMVWRVDVINKGRS